MKIRDLKFLTDENIKVVSFLRQKGFDIIDVKEEGWHGTEDKRLMEMAYKEKQFIKPRVGDWVSFHWGHVCDVLTEHQVKNLDFYTQKAIEFYNSP